MIPQAKTGLEKLALEALRHVMDPELGINVVDLGLVQRLEERRGHFHLAYKLTSATCPVGDMIARGMREALESLEGCRGVQAELLEDAWSPDDMSPEGCKKLNF